MPDKFAYIDPAAGSDVTGAADFSDATAQTTPYQTLKAALAANVQNLTTMGGNFYFWVKAGIETYNNSPVTISSTWTTSASFRIFIQATADGWHDGTFNTTVGYTLRDNGGSGASVLIKESPRVTCRGFRVIRTTLGRPIWHNSFSGEWLLEHMMAYSGEGVAIRGAGGNSDGNRTIIRHCVAIGSGLGSGNSAAIDAPSMSAGSQIVEHCTAIANGTAAAISYDAAQTVRWCYAHNRGAGAAYGGTGWAGSTRVKNASSDTSGDAGYQSIAFSTSSGAYFTNTTAGSENLRIGVLSSLKDAATDSTATLDVLNKARHSPPDIGAFEEQGLSKTLIGVYRSNPFHGTGTFTTPSFTVPSNCLLVAAAFMHTSDGATPGSGDMTITDSGSGTWTSRVNRERAPGPDFGGVYAAAGKAWTSPITTGGSRTLTLDGGARNAYTYIVHVFAYTNYNTSSPVGATAVGDVAPTATPGSLDITLSAAPATDSSVVGMVGLTLGVNAVDTSSPGTGWVEAFDQTDNNQGSGNYTHSQSQTRAGSTSTSVAWADVGVGNSQVNTGLAIALEIKLASTTITLIVADMSHAQTSDAIVLTQANTLALNDSRHTQTIDAVTLTQANTLTLADSSHAQTLDAVTLSQANVLALADSRHAQSIDAVVLTQANTLAVNDSQHAQTTDAVTLTQANTLAIADSRHPQSIDSFALSQGYTMSINDSRHAQTIDGVTLSEAATLDMADSRHGHTVESIELTQGNVVAVNDSRHPQTIGAVEIFQGSVIALEDSRHSQTIDSVTLTAAGTLVVADSRHSQTIDSISLTQANLLAVSDSRHAQTSDSVTLSLADILVVADSRHAQASENISISQANTLVVADARHEQRIDSLSLIQANLLSVADSRHSQSIENLTLESGITLVLTDSRHAQQIDGISLVQANLLNVSDSRHAQRIDSVGLLPSSTLVVNDIIQAQRIDSVVLRIPGTGLSGTVFSVPWESNIYQVSASDNIYKV